MPPFVQPQSLYNLSLGCVNQVVDQSCSIIQRRSGNYDQPQVKLEIKSFQDFLWSNVPSELMDEIAGYGTLPADGRVKLALLMHPTMRKFSTAMNGECRVISDDFWISQFAKLHKLVHLNLYFVCTDEILQVVSENCPLLEDINIISKVEIWQIDQLAGNFNALRLKLFVSDDGLGYLVKCQKLRRITTNKMSRTHCGGRMMTHAGLRTLLKGLPNLECLRYEDLGTVIAGCVNDVNELAVTYVCDNHPSRRNVEAAAKLCPRLTHLCLCMPYENNQPSHGSPRVQDDIATALAESSIFPTTLELQQFCFTKELSNLLVVKGSVLTSLFLYTVWVIGVTELLTIGELCLSLENLHIKGLGSEIVTDSVNKWVSNVSMGIPLYRRLECLHLSGKEWKPHQVLELFLMTAKGLTSLSVSNSTLVVGSATALDDFVMKHQFPELQSANFCPGSPLSLEAIQSLIYKSPKLTHLMVFEHYRLKQQDIQPLQNELRSKNLNIKIILQQIS